MPLSASERALIRSTIIDIAKRRQRPGTGSVLTTERTARMVWPDLSGILTGIPWAVVGAVATRNYMPERTTRDLDVAVLSRDSDRARELLQQAGLVYQGELTIGGSSWLTASGEPLDVLELEEPWWASVLTEAATNRDPQNLPILPLEYLVLMKLTSGRVHDLGDVTRMLGAAGDEDLARVRKVISERSPELSEDVESIITLGKMEYEDT
jgi:hypothetical protein